MFKILLGPSSRRFLKKCEKGVYTRTIGKLNELSANPFPSECKRVISRKEKIFRVRVGDYRIQYVVYHDKKEILISDIDKRPRAYQ